MEQKVQELADLIISNHANIKKKMFWEIESNQSAVMSALIAAAEGKTTDPEKYAECLKILKQNAGFLSEFRGIGQAMVVSKMMLVKDPEDYVKGCMEVYKKLRSIHKFTASPYMVMAAITIYENGGLEKADENIDKLETFYATLKKAHPFLISDQDRGYLAMLITSGFNLDEMANNIEACYQACKSLSIYKNSINSMSQILGLSKMSAQDAAYEVERLIKGLKAAKTPISKELGLGALGALVLVDKPVEEKVAMVAEVAEYLKSYKAFKWYNMDKRTRTIYATLIVFMACADNVTNNLVGNIGSTVTMVIIEQLIMSIIILCATSSANAASSSSGSN